MLSSFKKLSASARKCPPRRVQPSLEALEDRMVPAFALQLTGSQIVLPLSLQGTYATGTGSADPADDNQGFNFNGNNFTGTGGFQQSYSFEQGNAAATKVIYNPNANTGGNAVTVTDISSGSLLAAQVVSNVYDTPAAGLQMVKTFSYDINSNEVLVTLQLTNNSPSTTYNQVEYQDNADVGNPTHDVSTTSSTFFNDHMATGVVFPNQSSTTPFPYVMSIASNDPRTFATVVYVTNPIRNNPFIGVTAPVLASGIPPDPAPPDNYGIGISFNIGDIAPGQTATIQYNLLGNFTVQDAQNQWSQATAGQGACGLTNLADATQNAFRPLRYVFNATTNFFSPNAPAGTYSGNLTVHNASALPIGPNFDNQITIVLPSLPEGVTVVNPSGFTSSGSPYITVSGTALKVNGTVRLPITLTDPDDVHLSTFNLLYPLEVWSGAFDPRVV